MSGITLPVAVMAALALYAGVYRFWLYILNRSRIENLYFSILCLLISVYDLASFNLYNSGVIELGIVWQRVQFCSTGFITIAVTLFITRMQAIRFNRISVFYYLLLTAFALSSWIDSPLVLSMEQAFERNMAFSGMSNVFQEARPGLILNAFYILVFSSMVLNMFRIFREFAKNDKKDWLALYIAFPIFFFSATMDILIGAGVFSFVYTMEYAFLALLTAMDYLLVHRYNRLFQDLENVNERLELQVANRTAKIQRMADSILDLNKELEDKNKILQELSERDSLTKLYNHAALLDRLSEVFSQARRQKYPVGYIMMDIDHFKQLNDTYGHPNGDRIIRAVAEILATHSRPYDVKGRYEKSNVQKKNLRNYDITGRYGGDEFGVVLPYCGEAETTLVTNRILEKIREIELPELPGLKITASLGAVYWKAGMPCDNEKELIHAADRALYEAKRGGRNQYIVKAFDNNHPAG